MASQIKFYQKNEIDIDDQNTVITVTDSVASNNGQDYVALMRNRNNESAWITTGSTDAANTQLDIDLVVSRAIDRIIIVGHNLKAFTIQYWDGSSFVNFSTTISETANNETTNEFIFNEVDTDQIRIIITGCQTVDEQKIIRQLIVCKSLGQLSGWPQVRRPVYSLEKSVTKMLSGKSHITRQRGNFSCELTVASYSVESDLDVLESIYFAINGVIVWINANDDEQFKRTHISYRKQDIFLMQPSDEWEPEFYKYCYSLGLNFKMRLVEVIR